jgi:purine-nucleoside phosphorylase
MENLKSRSANYAAGIIKRTFGLQDDAEPIGVILGSGWGDVLTLENQQEVSLKHIPAFEKNLPDLEGHKRTIMFGNIASKQVIVLNGRLHLNEVPYSEDWLKLVRLQVEMLIMVGVKQLIVTNAAGCLKYYRPETDKQEYCFNASQLEAENDDNHELHVGEVAVIDGFVSVFAPVMPLWGGEFCSADDAISERLINIALRSQGDLLIAKKTGLAMMRGPQFEGNKYDKEILSRTGAGVAGMSMLPEAYICSLHDTKMLGLSFVTNDYQEKHSHPENLRRAGEASAHLGQYLKEIITHM